MKTLFVLAVACLLMLGIAAFVLAVLLLGDPEGRGWAIAGRLAALGAALLAGDALLVLFALARHFRWGGP